MNRGILFSAPMVRAILAGSKTQTRRIVKQQPAHYDTPSDLASKLICPYGAPGDRLWVRETFMDLGACFLYRADATAEQERAIVAPGQPWKPAIHMPRVASRITLEITDVRVERLQEISPADAKDEGVDVHEHADHVSHAWCYVEEFQRLWESINGPGSWDANPYVWVLSFERVR